MKESRIAALLFILPTILWAVIGYLFYQSIKTEYDLPFNMNNFITVTPLWQIILILILGYFLSLTIGIVYYAEMRFWNKI